MPKYKFKGEPYRHYHTYPVETEAFDKDGTKRTITTFESRQLKAGEIVEMEEERFKTANLADRFEPVESSGGRKQDIDTTASETAEKKPSTTSRPETEWTAVLSQGVMDVRAAVAALDNPDDLKALQKEEEKSGSPRKMVLDAIDKRMGELKK